MKKITSLLLLLPFCALAQKGGNPQTFAKSITPEDLKKQLYIVAGPEMEGRETATAGQRKAAAYIEGQFKQLGLLPGNKDSYQLYYNVYEDSLTHAALEVNGRAFQLNKDFTVNGNDIAATMRFNQVVLVGAAATDSLKNANLAGRLVLVAGNVPMGRNAGQGIIALLQSKGVAGILLVNNNLMRNSGRRQQTVNLFKRTISPQ